jgi:predicted DCC family thiol-disulfide oxidoreductase YuxK
MVKELSDNIDKGKTRGWVLYDAECPFCLGLLERFRLQIEAAGFLAAPLQSDWVRERLSVPDDQLLAEMKLLLPSGDVYGGAEAIFHFARSMPSDVRPVWAWAVVILGKLPFARALARAVYKRVAARRHCLAGQCSINAREQARAGGRICAR